MAGQAVAVIPAGRPAGGTILTCGCAIGNQILGLVQLVPAVAAGVLAVQQHVKSAPDGRGHPRAVAVEPAQLGRHRIKLRVLTAAARGRGQVQARQRELPVDAPGGLVGGDGHARQGELARNGIGPAGSGAGLLLARVHAGDCSGAASPAWRPAVPPGLCGGGTAAVRVGRSGRC